MKPVTTILSHPDDCVCANCERDRETVRGFNKKSQTTKIDYSEEAYQVIADLRSVRDAIAVLGNVITVKKTKAMQLLFDLKSDLEGKLNV